MKKSIKILFWLTVTSASAQVNFTNPDEAAVVSYQTKEIDMSNVETQGSPYIDDVFKKGQIYMYGNAKLTGKLRYNAFSSEIELQKTQTEYTVILKRNYISASIGDKRYKLYPYVDENNGGTRTGYFNPLNKGRVALLFKPEKKLRRGRTPATNYDRLVPPRFIDISSYYIQIGEEPAKKIYLKKRSFYKLLGKDDIQSYVKDNDLNLRNVRDVIKLLDYYNNN